MQLVAPLTWYTPRRSQWMGGTNADALSSQT
jgi:hypothetical protein